MLLDSDDDGSQVSDVRELIYGSDDSDPDEHADREELTEPSDEHEGSLSPLGLLAYDLGDIYGASDDEADDPPEVPSDNSGQPHHQEAADSPFDLGHLDGQFDDADDVEGEKGVACPSVERNNEDDSSVSDTAPSDNALAWFQEFFSSLNI